VTYLTATAREASELLALTAKPDPRDAYSRVNPQFNDASAFGEVPAFRFGIPSALEFAGCAESPALFDQARKALEAAGGTAVEIDFAPFAEAARLLYEGPWVAERYSVAGELMETQPDTVLPVIRDVLAKAPGTTAVDAFRAQYRLQALKQVCDAIMGELDFVLTPSVPRPVTLAELEADPIGPNSLLGYYTNFINLLDYAAVAVPAGFMANKLPWGVTVFGRPFTDQYLLSIADRLQRSYGLPVVGGSAPDLRPLPRQAHADRARIVVCGAHMDGLALNWQLLHRGGRLVERTLSAPRYRLFAIEGAVARPGMTRVSDQNGSAIEVEVWELPSAELGSFLTGIPAPLGLGKVELSDGRWETGFICDTFGLEGAREITSFGGWRRWMANTASVAAGVAVAR